MRVLPVFSPLPLPACERKRDRRGERRGCSSCCEHSLERRGPDQSVRERSSPEFTAFLPLSIFSLVRSLLLFFVLSVVQVVVENTSATTLLSIEEERITCLPAKEVNSLISSFSRGERRFNHHVYPINDTSPLTSRRVRKELVLPLVTLVERVARLTHEERKRMT